MANIGKIPPGNYYITNVKNGPIDGIIPSPKTGGIPVVKVDQTWQVQHSKNDPFINIHRKSLPANEDPLVNPIYPPPDGKLVLAEEGAQPDKWLLLPIGNKKYIVYGTMLDGEHRHKHWQLRKPDIGTQVVVSADHKHQVNQLLRKVTEGTDPSLLTAEMNKCEHEHPECFWKFEKVDA